MRAQFNQGGLIDLLSLTPSQVKQLEVAVIRHSRAVQAFTPQERIDNEILRTKLATATNRAGKMMNKGLIN